MPFAIHDELVTYRQLSSIWRFILGGINIGAQFTNRIEEPPLIIAIQFNIRLDELVVVVGTTSFLLRVMIIILC